MKMDRNMSDCAVMGTKTRTFVKRCQEHNVETFANSDTLNADYETNDGGYKSTESKKDRTNTEKRDWSDAQADNLIDEIATEAHQRREQPISVVSQCKVTESTFLEELSPDKEDRLKFDRLKKFPEKLWDAVSQGDGIFVWSDDGLSLVVDELKFIEGVMRLHPGLVQIQSFPNFRRQMREYGFQWGMVGNNIFYFTHPYFQRGMPNLTQQVQTRRHTRNKVLGVKPGQGVGRPRKSTKIPSTNITDLPQPSPTITAGAVEGTGGLTQEHIAMFLKALSQLPNMNTCCKHQQEGLGLQNQLSQHIKSSTMPSEAGDAAQFMCVPPQCVFPTAEGNQNCNNSNGCGSGYGSQTRGTTNDASHSSSNGPFHGSTNPEKLPYYQAGNSYQGPGAVWTMPTTSGLYSNSGYWFPAPRAAMMCLPSLSNFSAQPGNQLISGYQCDNNISSSQESGEETSSLQSSQTSSIYQSDAKHGADRNSKQRELTRTRVCQEPHGRTLIVEPKEEDCVGPLVLTGSTPVRENNVHRAEEGKSTCSSEDTHNLQQEDMDSNDRDDQGYMVRLNPEHVPINGGSQGFRIHLRHLQHQQLPDNNTKQEPMSEQVTESNVTVDVEH